MRQSINLLFLQKLTIMLETDKYIVPVFNVDNTDGIGFFVGHYFFTSGHVVASGTPFFFIDGKKYLLEKGKALFLKTLDGESTFETGLDIAVFPIDSVNSSLEFANNLVEVGATLTSLCAFRHYSEEFGEAWSIERIPGRVSHEMGNFFKCDLSRTLHEGSSGSPILLDDKVIGILCGNFPEDPENRILYMKASAITHLLE